MSSGWRARAGKASLCAMVGAIAAAASGCATTGGGTTASSGTTASVVAATGRQAFVAREEPRQLPELRFVDADGRERTLAEFRGKGVLLNLWAPWCAPCRKEMPALERLASQRGGPDFEVVALSIDKKGMPAAAAFHEALGLNALEPYADTTRQAVYLLGPRGLPTTLLIDAEGREVARALGAREWDNPAVVSEIVQRLDLD